MLWDCDTGNDRQLHLFHVENGQVVEIGQFIGDGHAAEEFWALTRVWCAASSALYATNGRKLARCWTGAKAYKAPPPGTLKEWHWRALVKAYGAGDAGLEGEYGDYAISVSGPGSGCSSTSGARSSRSAVLA